ncbi:MAG TPA: hypothetical protein VGQ52_05020 [Gemmatimonadaceae bacterium]|jgi:hypothetical protein|nr:hypothetical protein [Gemmatimonadaceae bacterium]
MRTLLLGLGLACTASVGVNAQPAGDLDLSLQRLVSQYTGLYTRDSLPRWRELFLPTFTSASIAADSTVTLRRLEEFYSAQERAFSAARRMGERLENVRFERRGRLATVWADFVYWYDDSERRGHLVLTAICERNVWRFASLMFSYYD